MSYAASSVMLNDREKHPFFLRTSPSDDLQCHFMVELIRSFSGSKINAVNLLYSSSLYGVTAAEVSHMVDSNQYITLPNVCKSLA